MTLAPFYAAPLQIQTHILAAILVSVLTPLQFWGWRRGSLAHRTSGYAWLSAMIVVALSSFFIRSSFHPSLAGFGLIHLLSIGALFSSAMIIRHARAGRIRAHQRYVTGLAIGFVAAGLFTLLPSRIMGQMGFGQA